MKMVAMYQPTAEELRVGAFVDSHPDVFGDKNPGGEACYQALLRDYYGVWQKANSLEEGWKTFAEYISTEKFQKEIWPAFLQDMQSRGYYQVPVVQQPTAPKASRGAWPKDKVGDAILLAFRDKCRKHFGRQPDREEWNQYWLLNLDELWKEYDRLSSHSAPETEHMSVLGSVFHNTIGRFVQLFDKDSKVTDRMAVAYIVDIGTSLWSGWVGSENLPAFSRIVMVILTILSSFSEAFFMFSLDKLEEFSKLSGTTSGEIWILRGFKSFLVALVLMSVAGFFFNIAMTTLLFDKYSPGGPGMIMGAFISLMMTVGEMEWQIKRILNKI